MRIYTICAKHNTTALVGAGTPLEELECVTCIKIQDEANRWRPCCSAYNTTCCGHDDDDRLLYLEIDSPGYCNRDHAAEAEIPF